ncbi:uncharacterized protein J3D65DRAFT_615693 [Phyllosticta citribraziliensis]|uniref:Uncharacterized protein n=1 Tax=Phyllosticta citribraziliensis TaxID=989973 RepID=A0ABR1M1B1_9PEZI
MGSSPRVMHSRSTSEPRWREILDWGRCDARKRDCKGPCARGSRLRFAEVDVETAPVESVAAPSPPQRLRHSNRRLLPTPQHAPSPRPSLHHHSSTVSVSVSFSSPPSPPRLSLSLHKKTPRPLALPLPNRLPFVSLLSCFHPLRPRLHALFSIPKSTSPSCSSSPPPAARAARSLGYRPLFCSCRAHAHARAARCLCRASRVPARARPPSHPPIHSSPECCSAVPYALAAAALASLPVHTVPTAKAQQAGRQPRGALACLHTRAAFSSVLHPRYVCACVHIRLCIHVCIRTYTQAYMRVYGGGGGDPTRDGMHHPPTAAMLSSPLRTAQRRTLLIAARSLARWRQLCRAACPAAEKGRYGTLYLLSVSRGSICPSTASPQILRATDRGKGIEAWRRDATVQPRCFAPTTRRLESEAS